MEMTYPWVFYAGIIVAAVIFVFTLRNSRKYKGGKRAANTNFSKEIPYYRRLLIEYEFLKILASLSLIASVILSSFLMAKPVEVRYIMTEEHHRDIFISFDISTSLDGVNLELCEELKDFVGTLKGERFGFSIFNARSVVIVPLTTDYDYVISMIDYMEASIEEGQGAEYYYQLNDVGLYGWRFSGTLSDYGSSFIGDGLASALYSFPDLDEDPDRSRLIVFVTDNELNDPDGYSIVSVDEACQLCKERGVKVFALAPDFVTDERSFKASIESTGGGYYNTRRSNAMRRMLADVQKTDVTATYTMETRVVDVPEAAAIGLCVSVLCYAFCIRRMKI